MTLTRSMARLTAGLGWRCAALGGFFRASPRTLGLYRAFSRLSLGAGR